MKETCRGNYLLCSNHHLTIKLRHARQRCRTGQKAKRFHHKQRNTRQFAKTRLSQQPHLHILSRAHQYPRVPTYLHPQHKTIFRSVKGCTKQPQKIPRCFPTPQFPSLSHQPTPPKGHKTRRSAHGHCPHLQQKSIIRPFPHKRLTQLFQKHTIRPQRKNSRPMFPSSSTGSQPSQSKYLHRNMYHAIQRSESNYLHRPFTKQEYQVTCATTSGRRPYRHHLQTKGGHTFSQETSTKKERDAGPIRRSQEHKDTSKEVSTIRRGPCRRLL